MGELHGKINLQQGVVTDIGPPAAGPHAVACLKHGGENEEGQPVGRDNSEKATDPEGPGVGAWSASNVGHSERSIEQKP